MLCDLSEVFENFQGFFKKTLNEVISMLLRCMFMELCLIPLLFLEKKKAKKNKLLKTKHVIGLRPAAA